jgi:hypothetical protein
MCPEDSPAAWALSASGFWRVERFDRDPDEPGRILYVGPSETDAHSLRDWCIARGVPAVVLGRRRRP